MVAFVRYDLKFRWKQHSRLPLFLLMVLVVATGALAQTGTAIQFNFDREMAGYGSHNADSALLPTTLSSIPSWMNRQLPGQGDTLYVFGISDPGLADTVARNQAVFRALAFGALADVTDCEHISDFYTQEKRSAVDSKYEEIYRFSAAVSGNIPVSTVLHDTILASSEAVVLMGIPRKNLQGEPSKILRVDAILYNMEAAMSGGNRMSRKVDVSIRKRNADEMMLLDAGSFYQINGKATGMRCMLPQSQAVYDRNEFYYTAGDSSPRPDSAEVSGTTCKQGLWIAYVSQIMEQLSMQTKRLSADSQGLSDKTEGSYTELSRERTRTRLSWRIRAIDIHDDKMWVRMITSKY